MHFDTYDAALSAAIKQSKGQLGDVKVYIKLVEWDRAFPDMSPEYKIGFTPDNANDCYVYNGEVKQAEKQ